MAEEQQEGRRKGYVLMRMLMDLGMGIIYIGVAVFIFLAPRLGFESQFFEPPFSYIFAGICILYGGFRIYRGVKKNYFRE